MQNQEAIKRLLVANEEISKALYWSAQCYSSEWRPKLNILQVPIPDDDFIARGTLRDIARARDALNVILVSNDYTLPL